MISFHLREEEQMIQETVRAFAASEVRPAARACEKARAVSPELEARFGELGLAAVQLPEVLGGAGLGAIAGALVAEELAFGDPGIAAALLSSFPAACVLEALGSEEQRKRFLGGRLALALSDGEPGVAAARSGESWTLQGRKAFVASGGSSCAHVVVADLGVFVVPAGAAGLAAGARHDLLGLRAVPFAEVVLEGCVVPEENRLSTGDGLRDGLLRASLLSAALAVGVARAAYEYAREYAQERQAFGKPIGHFQALAFMLSDMAMDVDAARWMVWRAASQWDAGAPDPLATSAALVHAHEAAMRVSDQAVQILGGHGYMQDHPVEKWMRDAKTLGLYLATAEYCDGVAQSAILGVEANPEDVLPQSTLQPILT